jgi:hypothetical protein
LLDLSTTWLSTTGTPTAIKLNVTDTANVPAASLLIDLQVGGTSKFSVAKGGAFSFRSGATLASISTDGTGRILLNGSTSAGARVAGDLHIGSNDVVLVRDSTGGILAQRDGTNAQAFRVYNTFPGTTANEWAELDWKTDGTLRFGTNHAGTGAAKTINIVVGGTSKVSISSSQFVVGSNFVFGSDNSHDIGASGANRPRNVYVAGTVEAASFTAASRLGLTASAGNAVVTTYNSSPLLICYNNGTELVKIASATSWMFTSTVLVQFGGTTSAFPAIKRNGTGIDIVLANDSGFAPIKGKLTTDTAYTATVVVPTGFLTLYDSTGQAYRVPCVV